MFSVDTVNYDTQKCKICFLKKSDFKILEH